MTLIYFRYIDLDIVMLIVFKLIALLGYIYIGKKMGFVSHDKLVLLRGMLKFKAC
jgi:hypothetical protein